MADFSNLELISIFNFFFNLDIAVFGSEKVKRRHLHIPSDRVFSSSCVHLLDTKEAFQGTGFLNLGFEICALIWNLPISLGMLICIGIQKNSLQDSCYLALKGLSFLGFWCKWTCRPNLSSLDFLKYFFQYLVKIFPAEKPNTSLNVPCMQHIPSNQGTIIRTEITFFSDKITLIWWGLQLLRKMWAILTSFQEENGTVLRCSVC